MSYLNLFVERVPGYDKLVRIPLTHSDDLTALIAAFTDTVEACFKEGYSQIIVDLKELPYPPASLIAVLIEATVRARRLDGDVLIANASRTAKNNLATFSALSYLTVDGDHTSAFGNQLVSPETGAAHQELVAEPADLKSTTHPLPNHAVESLHEDISDPPILEKMEESFDELTSYEDKSLKHLRVQSTAQNLYTICDFVTGHAEKVGFDSKEIGKTKIAVYEACLNVIEHAYHSNPDNWIDVWVEYDSRKFTIVIQDYGIGFGEFSFKDYDVLSAMDSRKTGGFGLYIIRRSMDEIDYKADPANGNRMTLTKYLNKVIQ